MTVRNGTLSGSGSSRVNVAKAVASGSIAADGRVSLTLEAQNADNVTVKGTMTGQWAKNVITLSGMFDDGTKGNATLTWAPDRPAAAAANAAQRGEGPRRTQR